MGLHRSLTAFVCVCLTGLSAGCAWEPVAEKRDTSAPRAVTAPAPPHPGYVAASVATDMVGVPYVWGGQTPRGFDCSGLVFYAYTEQGVTLPRTAAAQLAYTRPVNLADSRPGDLVFFRTDAKGGHVGILIDDNRFVHAPSRGKRVAIADFDNPYYRKMLIRAGRLPGLD